MSDQSMYTCCKCKTTQELDPHLDKLVCKRCNKPACWNCEIFSRHMTQLTHNWIQIPLDEKAGHVCGYVCCKCGDLRKVTVADAQNTGPWWSSLFSTFSRGHSKPLKLATVICNGCSHGCCRLCHRFKVASRVQVTTTDDVDWATRQALLAAGKTEELQRHEHPNVVARLDAWMQEMQTPPLSTNTHAESGARARTSWECKQEAKIRMLTEAMRAAGLLSGSNTPSSTNPSPTPSLTDGTLGSIESGISSLEPLSDIRDRGESASTTPSLAEASSSDTTKSGSSNSSSPDLHQKQHTVRMEELKETLGITPASQRSSFDSAYRSPSVASDPFPYEEWLSGK